MKSAQSILILFSLFLSIVVCNSEESEKKKGIKTENVLEYKMKEKFGSIVEILLNKTDFKYDKNGNMIERSFFDSGDSLSDRRIFTYGINSNMILPGKKRRFMLNFRQTVQVCFIVC